MSPACADSWASWRTFGLHEFSAPFGERVAGYGTNVRALTPTRGGIERRGEQFFEIAVTIGGHAGPG